MKTILCLIFLTACVAKPVTDSKECFHVCNQDFSSCIHEGHESLDNCLTGLLDCVDFCISNMQIEIK